MKPSRSSKRRRRKQHGRAPSIPPRRHKKSSPTKDIEEQLRQQRKKRALEHKATVQRRDPPATLGGYKYDAERSAYFPADSFTKGGDNRKQAATKTRDDGMERNHVQLACARSVTNARTASCQSLRYAMEITSFNRRQHHLRSVWAGRLLKMGIKVVPTSAPSADSSRLMSMLPPLRTDVFHGPSPPSTTPLDSVCKSRLHPSAKTFDIHMGTDPKKLPSMATLVDGGSHVRFAHPPELWEVDDTPPHSEFHESISLEVYPLPQSGEEEPHSIRFAPTKDQTPSDYHFAAIGRTSIPNQNMFHLWQGGDGILHHVESVLPFNVNGFCFHPHESKRIIGLAPAYSRGVLPLLLDLENETFHQCRVGGHVESDALCAEFLSKHLLIGHRNGSISIIDDRVDHISSYRNAKGAGSVTAITVLKDGSHQFVTKGCFGSRFLWDARNMGGSTTTSRKGTPLARLEIPLLQKTKNSCCNGVALDPLEKFCISPFVNAEERPCLAFWSLSTGTYLGCKELMMAPAHLNSDTTTAGTDNGMPFVELSSTITPAWNPSSVHDNNKLEPEKGAWGFWFKSGFSPSGHPTPNFVGSIHHVTFPGHWET